MPPMELERAGQGRNITFRDGVGQRMSPPAGQCNAGELRSRVIGVLGPTATPDQNEGYRCNAKPQCGSRIKVTAVWIYLGANVLQSPIPMVISPAINQQTGADELRPATKSDPPNATMRTEIGKASASSMVDQSKQPHSQTGINRRPGLIASGRGVSQLAASLGNQRARAGRYFAYPSKPRPVITLRNVMRSREADAWC